MKYILFFVMIMGLNACSALRPYKDQSFEYLQGITHHPTDYYGKVVSFSGEIKGLTEDILTIRLVLKTDAPFYYAATAKGKNPSYELLLVDYTKISPEMSGLKKGNTIKILARVTSYEKRNNMLGTEIGVLHLTAFALADRTLKKDFFHSTSPEKQLYESWKKGRLFYEQMPEQIISSYPAQSPSVSVEKKLEKQVSFVPSSIVYDEEEEDFMIEKQNQDQ